MSTQNTATLKILFQTGSTPTEEDFADLIESSVRIFDARNQSSARDAAGRADGTIVFLGECLYQVDKTATGRKSALCDLAVDGLVPFGKVSSAHFGTLGDGVSNDTDAFNRAIAYCRTNKRTLYVPTGVYCLDALDPLFQKLAPRRECVKICGEGREKTVLRYTGDLSGPLLNASPDPAGVLGYLEVADLTIDGSGKSGIALYLSHMTKCNFSRLWIRNVRDIGIYGEEWWDSTVIDVYLHTVGSVADQKPAIRLKNRSATDHNSSCNNIGFYDLHIEEHPYRGIELLETTRKITFSRLKCHHNPNAWPPLGTDHVVLDAMNVASGGGYNISFVGCHLSACSGSGVVIDNTGGSSANGFSGVSYVGGSISGAAHYGLEAIKGQDVMVSTSQFSGCQQAAFRIDSDASGVQIDWNTVALRDVTHQHFGTGGVLPTTTSKQIPPIVDGVLSVVGTLMVLQVPGGVGGRTIRTLNGGGFGREVTFLLRNRSDPIIFDVSGNIRTKDNQSRTLTAYRDIVRFVYDSTSALWIEC